MSTFGQVAEQGRQEIDQWKKDIGDIDQITGADGQVATDLAFFKQLLQEFVQLFKEMVNAKDVQAKFWKGQKAYAMASSLLPALNDAQNDNMVVLGEKLKLLKDYQSMVTTLQNGVNELNTGHFGSWKASAFTFGPGRVHNWDQVQKYMDSMPGLNEDMSMMMELLNLLSVVAQPGSPIDQWTDSSTLGQLGSMVKGMDDVIFYAWDDHIYHVSDELRLLTSFVKMWWGGADSTFKNETLSETKKQPYDGLPQELTQVLSSFANTSQQMSSTSNTDNTEMQYQEGMSKQTISTLDAILKTMSADMKNPASKEIVKS